MMQNIRKRIQLIIQEQNKRVTKVITSRNATGIWYSS